MASDPVPANAAEAIEEQIVAYLDGELSPQERRRFEGLLASDGKLREKVLYLQRTWDLLDKLDREPVGKEFSHTTLEMVAVAAEEDVRIVQAGLPRKFWWRCLLGTIMVCSASLLGMVVTLWTEPNPNQQLLRDLPVLENLDALREADDVQFLRMLQKERLFVKEAGDEN